MASSGTKRSIDFLRPEQLQRKREGDRRSQALQRSRTKAYVQFLEQKVERLEGQVRALEDELQRKSGCLDTVVSLNQSTPHQIDFSQTTLNEITLNQNGVDVTYEALPPTNICLGSLTDDSSEFWTRILNETTLLPSPSSLPTQDIVSIPFYLPSTATYVPLAPSSWTTLPKHIAPTCTLDHVITDLIATRRQHDNMAEFQRHDFPSVQSLLNPSSTGATPVTSAIVKQIIHAMTVPTLPEQVAILYVMSTIIRWHISPTRANYASIPPWLRPTPAQLIYPHAPWLDIFVWPRGRDRFVQHARYQNAHELMARLCNESLSINWGHQPSDMFMSADAADRSNNSDIVLNPIFERHIRNLDNWTVGQIVLDVFPELAGEVNIGIPRNADVR